MIKKMCFLKRKPSLSIVHNNSRTKIRILHAKSYVMLKAIHTFRKDYWQFCFFKNHSLVVKKRENNRSPVHFQIVANDEPSIRNTKKLVENLCKKGNNQAFSPPNWQKNNIFAHLKFLSNYVFA